MAGCGGGGGGAATQAVTKVYLFGTMSSNTRFGVYSSSGKITSVSTSMTVPAGIMVNYSSPAGVTSGKFPLRTGAVVPSGPVKVAASDITGTYDTASRVLAINIFNSPLVGAPLKSSTTGKGAEIATISFSLETPGVESPLPLLDPLPEVGQARPSLTSPFGSEDYLTGCTVNYVTTYQ